MPKQVDHQELVRSVDAKPRLKWTRQLHEQFVHAVTQVGGTDKATPKTVMRVMGVPELTLYHLKSHLQKYRLAKNRDVSAAVDDKKRSHPFVNEMLSFNVADELWTGDNTSQPQFNESLLQQIQMNVQRKLHEQIEVQKHLQLRIEAQGKYLQSVVRKAQETLAGYSSSCLTAETANAELSELVSAEETGCLSSSPTHGGFISKKKQNVDSSMDSCLTLGKSELKVKDASSFSFSAGDRDEIKSLNSKTIKMRGETEEFDLNA